jgi:hypothetical protein
MVMSFKLEPRGWAKRWLTSCRRAVMEISGYAIAIFLAEMLVKIGSHP